MRTTLALIFVLATAGAAGAVEIQKSGPEEFPTKHEMTAHLGYQAGYGGQMASSSGFKLSADYAYKFHPLVWFNLQVSELFGFGASSGPCTLFNGTYNCYYNGGWGTELAGGVKLKFRTRVPLVIEVPLLIGANIMYNRGCGDNGAAIVAHPGAGIKYFVTQKIGIGVSVSTAFGPGFHGGGKCGGSYTDFYGYFDFLAGAEFFL